MSDAGDIRELLEGWPYDPDNDVRILSGKDGREVLQVRAPLVLEQLEMQGRPEGLLELGAPQTSVDFRETRFSLCSAKQICHARAISQARRHGNEGAASRNADDHGSVQHLDELRRPPGDDSGELILLIC
jgi:hypothetical protein